MPAPSTLKLRKIWFQLHKWLGLLLAALIIPISLSGAILVWDHGLDERLHPQRFPTSGPAALPPESYAQAARGAMQPGERLASLSFPRETGSVQATLTKPAEGGGRPARAWAWIDPATGAVIERAGAGEGILRVLHVLHGSLMMPGTGRQIVGWIGIAMLISSLTGLWLWWPRTGGFRRGLRWRRQPSTNANLHHLAGFWIAIPLAMLSFTGAWISFPIFFGGLIGAAPPAAPSGPPALPLAETRLSPDAALAAASAYATGPVQTLSWPTSRSPDWRVSFVRGGGAAEVKVNDASGVAAPPPPPRPESFARTMRRWHDGTGMGPVWQAIIFVGGILPALLAVTGILMWLRSRRWRADVTGRSRGRRAVPSPAE